MKSPLKFSLKFSPKFSKNEEAQIVDAIKKAEMKTSGEIRVHIAKKTKISTYEEACLQFEKLGMTQTQERNGVLIFISENKKEFAIIGDRGIHEKVGSDFWHQVKDSIQKDFREKRFLSGILHGVVTCGEQLSQYFPRKSDDKNELSNDISHS